MIAFNTQSDSRWSHDIMTEGTDQFGKKWKDTLGKSSTSMGVGCLVTAMANIEQEKSDIELFPSSLNNLLKNHKGYFWLAKDSNNEIIYYGQRIKVSEKNASFIFMPVLEDIFLFKFTGWLKPKDYKEEENTYWIVRITTPWGGHYINFLHLDKNNNFVCFDTLTGYTKILKEKEITFLHRIKY